ncbi:hypothetical protein G7054_g5011 [Neopestalotiopsis clavispora]|nr:hypothetical protein G7054_g5011 [Neopestalotiopsis clavispora]
MEEFLGQDETSQLCITCQRTLERLIDPPIGTDPGGLHHESLDALKIAAKEGCLICNVLFKALRQDRHSRKKYQKFDSERQEDFKVELYGVAESIDADIAPAAGGNIWARFFFRFYDKVIEVGEDIRHGSRLVETRGELGQYLALSHCWGNIQPRPLMTKSDNISILTTRIPFELLGKTFQDAMVVTKHLGYRYLWIDMFCIVQDSVADWQRECSNMASIFANADLTIAASAAKDSNAGFLQKRPVWHTNITEWVRHLSPEYQEQDGSLIPFSFQVKNVPIQAMITSLPSTQEGGHPTYYSVAVKNDVLSTRAWAVQERLLAPRILSFYESQTIFECNTCIWYEKMHNPLLHRNDHNIFKGRESLVPKDFLAADDSQGIMDRWFSILERYTSCSITMADDRLPALSGVVERIQERIGDEYTAGLWRSYSIQGLMWRANSFPREYTITQFPNAARSRRCRLENEADSDDSPRDKHPRTVYIPSWSWASCANPIRMLRNYEAKE